MPFYTGVTVWQEKRGELQHLSNKQWQLTSNSSMLELDLTRAKSDLDAKKEFERRREVRFPCFEGMERRKTDVAWHKT